jgi:lipopolysaccharide biosynthesis protein
VRDLLRHAAVSGVGATRAARPAGWLLRPKRPQPIDDDVRATWLGTPSAGAALAVLAHWDPAGEFAEASTVMLDGLRAAGMDVVVVSTSAAHDQLVARLHERALAVVTRQNVGFDFLSWRRGLEVARREGLRADRVVLTNSSMYGPVVPLAPTMERLWALPSDVLGMTESCEFGAHLQSWFLGFKGPVTRSARFISYWERIRPATNKWGTILAHEMRWARDLADDGRPASVLVPASRTSRSRNPLTFTWQAVLEAGVPFLKRSLFLANPDRIDLRGWREVVGRHAPDFDLGIVDRDVLRLTGRAAP